MPIPAPPWTQTRFGMSKSENRSTNHYFIKDQRFASQQVANETFSVNGRGLGDIWGSICYFYKLSEDFGIQLKLSRHYMKSNRKREFGRRAAEVMSLLDSPGSMVFVDGNPTIKIRHQNIGYIPYPTTKKKWKNIPVCGHPSESASSTFCYQFDGKSHKGQKNMTTEEETLIIDALSRHGLSPIRLGGHLSLEQCVEHLSNCKLFIGVDSGFAHVSCSVRSPTYVIRNKRPVKDLDDIYFGKGVRFYDTADAFIGDMHAILRSGQ